MYMKGNYDNMAMGLYMEGHNAYTTMDMYIEWIYTNTAMGNTTIGKSME